MAMAENVAKPRMQPPKSFTTKDTKITKKLHRTFLHLVASVFFVLFVVDFSSIRHNAAG